MGTRPWQARTLVAWGEMLLARGGPGDEAAPEGCSPSVRLADAVGDGRARRARARSRACGCAFLSRRPTGRGPDRGANRPSRRLPSSDPCHAPPPSSPAPPAAATAPLDRPVPVLRRVEHAGRGGARARRGGPRRRRRRPRRAARQAGAAARRSSAERAPGSRPAIGELDRVLGGGLVPGSLVLLGGSPGIGKSTLTAMALGNLAGAPAAATLYVSGEESAAQVRLRAERLRRGALDVPVLAETDLDAVLATLEAERPEVCVIDSVQTLHSAELDGRAGLGRPGARGRRPASRGWPSAQRHRRAARRPRHQGGRARRPAGARAPRRLRAAVRGRARAHLPHAARAQEPLRLDQRGRGLRDARGRARRGRRRLARASSARRRARPGRVVLAAMEGSRPLLVEVQALVSPSELVPPRRVANGIDRNRLALVLAVLGRHARRRRRHARTSSSTSSAACGSTSRAPTSRSRSPWRARSGASRWRERRARRSRASARSGSPASCARVAHPDRRARRGRASSGCDPVDRARRDGSSAEAPSLRAASGGAPGVRRARAA